MNNVKLLGEEDFLSAMENEVKDWRKKYVTRGQLKSRDNIAFNYYVCDPEGAPKASITLVHGLG